MSEGAEGVAGMVFLKYFCCINFINARKVTVLAPSPEMIAIYL